MLSPTLVSRPLGVVRWKCAPPSEARRASGSLLGRKETDLPKLRNSFGHVFHVATSVRQNLRTILFPCSPHTCDMFWSHQLPGVLVYCFQVFFANTVPSSGFASRPCAPLSSAGRAEPPRSASCYPSGPEKSSVGRRGDRRPLGRVGELLRAPSARLRRQA